MPLSIAERHGFLAQPHVAALSVGAGPNRGPLTVPIWYYFVPGNVPWVLTPPDSRKATLIAAAGRFALLVHRTTPTVRYVSVEGSVIDTGPATEDQVRMMARRYLSAERVEPYVDFARREHIICMQPDIGSHPTSARDDRPTRCQDRRTTPMDRPLVVSLTHRRVGQARSTALCTPNRM